MIITLQLHDHKNEPHLDLDVEVPAKGTAGWLRGEIQSTLRVPRDYQHIFLNDERIRMMDDSRPLENVGIKQAVTVIVKHADLEKWSAVEVAMEKFRETTDRVRRPALAKEILDSAFELSETKFFSAYPRFSEAYNRRAEFFYRAVDKRRPAMEAAAKFYFGELHFNNVTDTPPTITFSEKSIGEASGIIVHVSHSAGTSDYFMKTNHGAGPSNNPAVHYSKPSLRELFTYQLLSLIGVGPRVHFPGDKASTVYVVYIATEKVEGLRVYNDIDLPERFGEAVSRAVVQLYMLAFILDLGDLHGANFGLDCRGRLSVFDFSPGCKNDGDVVEKFLKDSTMDTDSVGNCLKRSDAAKRRQIALEALQQWNLDANIGKANDSLSSIKKKFRLLYGTKFNAGTDDLDVFVEAAKEKNRLFMNM